jgi:hypothetical protein
MNGSTRAGIFDEAMNPLNSTAGSGTGWRGKKKVNKTPVCGISLEN